MSGKHPRPASASPSPAASAIHLADYPPGLLAVPTLEWMWSRSVLSLIGLSHCLPPGSRVALSCQHSHSIAANRNMLVEQEFLPNPELQWIYFGDADMVPPATAIAQLLARRKDFIVGLCYNRHPPYKIAAHFDGLPEEPCHRIEDAGLACALIHRRVFALVPRPWFEHPITGRGEDTYFCEKAREAGIEIWIDRTVEVGHLGLTDIRSDFALTWAATTTGREGAEQYLRGHAPREHAAYRAGVDRLRAAARER